MSTIRIILIALAAMLVLPQAAQASSLPGPSGIAGFGVAAVSDVDLGNARGGQALFATRLTVGTVVRMADDNIRADLRQTASVARVIMDIWWGTTGSEMIAQNVRAASGGL